MDLLLPTGSLLPVGLLPVGLRFPDTLVLIFGLKLPRRMARELVLPLMSRVSVGVRRRLSGIKKRQLQVTISSRMNLNFCALFAVD